MKASPKILMQITIVIALIVAALGVGFQSLTAVAKPVAQTTNLALNKPATASSALGGNTAAMAFDGNATGTRWESAHAVDPSWIQVDLGTTYNITSVILRWEPAYATAFQIQLSTNGTTWTNAYTTTTGTGGVQTLAVTGSARYVRMNGTVRALPYGYSLWEFEVYGTSGATSTATQTPTRTSTTVIPVTTTAAPGCSPSNSAFGKPATASSIENAGTPASLVVDGNAGTRWASLATDPQWVYVDLGSTQSICRVRLTWEAAYATSYQIQTSNDLATWTAIYSTTTGDGGTDDLTGLSGSGRYVRMVGTIRATQWGYSLWEFEIYTGSSSITHTPTRTPSPTLTSAGPTLTRTRTVTPSLTSPATITRTNTVTATVPPAGCGTTNVALNRPVTASSIENAGNAANLAVDGNVNGTRWASLPADPQWIYVDLGSTQTICRVKLTWEAAYASSYQIQVSNDTTTWTSIYGTTTGDGGVDDITGLSGSGRYVRMNGTVRGTVYGYSLWEMEVYVLTGPTLTPTKTLTPSITPTQVPLGNVVPLFNSSTSLEPVTVVDTGTAIITRYNDRARDRHARESMFAIYDHYLSHYWEHRTAAIEVIDRVAKGGTDITFNVTTQWKLSQPEFRAFFRGINTVAEYHHNALMTQVSGPDANGITNYTVTLNYNSKEGRAIQIGDRMEIEISQFLDAPPTGRANYYGTTTLYMVGQGGMVPWEGQGALLDSFPLPQSAWQGGWMTLPYQYSNEPLHRFKQMAPNTAPQNGQPFMLGRRLFHTNFGTGEHSELVAENGIFSAHVGKLGPRFYTATCDACHIRDGASLPPATGTTLTTMVVKVGTASGGSDPNLGTSMQPFNNAGASEGTANISSWTYTTGTYGDGTTYELRKPNYAFTGTVPTNFSVRRTPHLVGMGLLEAITETSIATIADPNDSNGDGISGRMQTVIDPVTGQTRMGRFGWKAGKATVTQQTAAALNGDMGVTTTIFPNLDCGSAQGSCGSGNEISNADLELISRYVRLLGVAARRNLNDAQVQRGETLFTTANCVACHKATLTTSIYAPLTEVRNQTIHPYTDLLLHDMGTGLADNLPEGIATGAEWRTTPLWSIGLTAGVSGGESYLHDGRARTLAEAILWHGGEANAAKEAFRTMNATDRAALIAFLMAQ